jgi:HEAT repeat protein
MSHEPELTGLEPQIGAGSPAGRPVYTPLERDESSPVLTGLEPELGGSRRVTTDPRLIALVLSATNPLERERAIRRIRRSGQARIYARELASIAPPYARRRFVGLWQTRYSIRQRVNAIAAVGALGQAIPDTIRPLFAALGGSNEIIRRAAIVALADLWRMNDLSLLTHENPLVRQRAADSLAHRRDPRTIGPLLVSLHDEDHYVRVAVARALGELGAYHATEDLLKLLGDQEPMVRRAAVEALGVIAANLAPDDPHAQSVVEPMVEVLQRGNRAERQAAALTLGHLGDTERATESLIAALRDRDHLVREGSARSLGMLGDSRAFEPLSALVEDTSPTVAVAAIGALAQLGDERAVGPLIAILRNEQSGYTLREAATGALREIGSEGALSALALFEGADSPPP